MKKILRELILWIVGIVLYYFFVSKYNYDHQYGILAMICTSIVFLVSNNAKTIFKLIRKVYRSKGNS